MTTRVASVEAVAPGRKTKPSVRERILIAGFDTPAGLAAAQAFAGRHARLVLQAAVSSADVAREAGHLAAQAKSVSLHATPFCERRHVIETVQAAVHTLGGIDAAVVAIDLKPDDLAAAAQGQGIEALLVAKLAPVLELVNVAANRMGLTWTRGTIFAVLSLPPVRDAREALVAQILKATLAGLVRREAERLAGQEIAVLAIVASPDADWSACTPDVGSLAARLACEDDGMLSGVVYEASNAIGC